MLCMQIREEITMTPEIELISFLLLKIRKEELSDKENFISLQHQRILNSKEQWYINSESYPMKSMIS